jgi:hypothetical protein
VSAWNARSVIFGYTRWIRFPINRTSAAAVGSFPPLIKFQAIHDMFLSAVMEIVHRHARAGESPAHGIPTEKSLKRISAEKP